MRSFHDNDDLGQKKSDSKYENAIESQWEWECDHECIDMNLIDGQFFIFIHDSNLRIEWENRILLVL